MRFSKRLIVGLLAGLLWCQPAAAAWARDTGATKAAHIDNGGLAGATTWNAGNLGATPSANDRTIAVLCISQAGSSGMPSITGLSDSTSSTWYLDRDSGVVHDTPNGFDIRFYVFSSIATGGAVNSITVTLSGAFIAAGAISLSAGAYSGLSTATGNAAAVDVLAGTTGTSAAPSSGATAATSAANELVIGAYGDAGFSITETAGTGFSIFAKDDANGATESGLEDKDSGSSGTTQTATMSLSASVPTWGMAALVYKLAGGGGGGPAGCKNGLLMSGVGCDVH